MKKIRWQPLIFIAVIFLIADCNKAGITIPRSSAASHKVRSITFTAISIKKNSSYTFNIPEITQSVIQGGSVTVNYRNALVIFDTWYSLPFYINENGNLLSLTIAEIRIGEVTIQNTGIEGSSVDYRFDITANN